MSDVQRVTVIGAGLAGSEAAWQIASQGVPVTLYEMRPATKTPAHHTKNFAELVCSNSLRANGLANAVGVLKEEMRRMNSIILDCADRNAVPAGGALAVDRDGFSGDVTRILHEHPLIDVRMEEITEIPQDGIVLIATGPLTAPRLSAQIQEMLGQEYFYFYDAAAPIVEKDSIDMSKVYLASRYDKGEAAYLNCPMTEEEFEIFHEALLTAETAEVKEFEKEQYFEGCMPIEVMASRGKQTVLFGPMKPVGLVNPHTGKLPHAVVQLRQDNAAGTLYNLVGFQTHLKWGEQKRVLSLIPGLENAEFVRFGVMHRNTFINSPKLLRSTYQAINRDNLFFAGQMTGVEGYVESAASGLIAGLNAGRLAKGMEPLVFPADTTLGSMAQYITTADFKHFQPMNANFGLFPPLEQRMRSKKDKNDAIANRALTHLASFQEEHHLTVGRKQEALSE
ncbi:FADH(2)-oxidizing methylenetetrahydrofolate--tRNA-(uracil(54)-C(5))-methyltransferase TrmFO [Paenibacillus sp. R14(2021)]|uniref:FADH(2)-oxidizing methylenetetrahydrofolate--tRNA-(uracil(54)-C(5))- methyltransferase TrmFO n=1 Tax=Paenibacillus sp. R14(2021) TaxID=2859228 RepID=UPI001C612B5E|nr:FADH(2)-oxidizing methylenetetrahydrofolate--tRNA-(uracil(54)-C(5))-methyltransferase TrmFO [Paenibacillus sp. R14(2021)]